MAGPTAASETTPERPRVTLDFNALISLEKDSDCAMAELRQMHEDGRIDLCIPYISASERQQSGEYLRNCAAFDQQFGNLTQRPVELLYPPLICDVAFLGRSILASDEMIELADKIHQVLFPNDHGTTDRKWRNHLGDIYGMWCHIYYHCDVFVTSDKNFFKASKIDQLRELGAHFIGDPKASVDWIRSHLELSR